MNSGAANQEILRDIVNSGLVGARLHLLHEAEVLVIEAAAALRQWREDQRHFVADELGQVLSSYVRPRSLFDFSFEKKRQIGQVAYRAIASQPIATVFVEHLGFTFIVTGHERCGICHRGMKYSITVRAFPIIESHAP